MKNRVRTHTFNGRTYKINIVTYLGGMTEIPSPEEESNTWEMTIVAGKQFKHLDNTIHEAMEAMGIPSEFLHDKQGEAKTLDIARFLWRLGYRLKKENV